MIQQTVRQMFLGLLGLENVPRLQNQSNWLESQLCPPPTHVSVPQGGQDDSPPPGEGVGRMERGGVLWSVPFHTAQGYAFSSRPGDMSYNNSSVIHFNKHSLDIHYTQGTVLSTKGAKVNMT